MNFLSKFDYVCIALFSLKMHAPIFQNELEKEKKIDGQY